MFGPATIFTLLADIAHEAVPNNEPVIPFCTVKLPVMSESPRDWNPFLITNSFAMSFPYPRMVIY
jgi:galactose-1-phosphate uridylyltransferase